MKENEIEKAMKRVKSRIADSDSYDEEEEYSNSDEALKDGRVVKMNYIKLLIRKPFETGFYVGLGFMTAVIVFWIFMVILVAIFGSMLGGSIFSMLM